MHIFTSEEKVSGKVHAIDKSESLVPVCKAECGEYYKIWKNQNEKGVCLRSLKEAAEKGIFLQQ